MYLFPGQWTDGRYRWRQWTNLVVHLNMRSYCLSSLHSPSISSSLSSCCSQGVISTIEVWVKVSVTLVVFPRAVWS